MTRGKASKIKKLSLRALFEDKPGGGLTDFGAKYRVEKGDAIATARQAIVASQGDVDKAADSLDISPSALRYYLNLEPSLEKTKDKVQKDDDNNGDEERTMKKESKKLSISLGELRKIIREELERAEIEEAKILMNEPMALGGGGFHTGPESRLPQLSDLMSIYDENEMIPSAELADWFKVNQLELVDMPPAVVVPNYKFVGQTLFGLDVKGNQSMTVNQVGPGRYKVEGKKLDPAAMVARMKYSS